MIGTGQILLRLNNINKYTKLVEETNQEKLNELFGIGKRKVKDKDNPIYKHYPELLKKGWHPKEYISFSNKQEFYFRHEKVDEDFVIDIIGPYKTDDGDIWDAQVVHLSSHWPRKLADNIKNGNLLKELKFYSKREREG